MVQALSPSLEATDSQGLGKPWMTGSPHFLLGKSRRGTAQMREEGAGATPLQRQEAAPGAWSTDSGGADVGRARLWLLRHLSH